MNGFAFYFHFFCVNLIIGNKLTEELAKEYLDSIGDNSYYALKYTVAEVLCLITSILQIVLTDEVTIKIFYWVYRIF